MVYSSTLLLYISRKQYSLFLAFENDSPSKTYYLMPSKVNSTPMGEGLTTTPNSATKFYDVESRLK
jgi:hypothetical protein